jgi:hypothetical protein
MLKAYISRLQHFAGFLNFRLQVRNITRRENMCLLCRTISHYGCVPCHHGMEAGLQVRSVAVNTVNKQSRTADQGVVLQLGGWAWGLQLLTEKINLLGKKKPRTWTDSLDNGPKRKQMDMRFGTWNVGCAITQAVSRWFPTTAPRVQTRV